MRRKRRKQSIPLNAILVSILGIVVFLGVIAMFVLYEDPNIDSATSCPREPGYTQVSLSVLLDSTDNYGAGQRLALINRVWDAVDTLDEYDRVKVYLVEQGQQTPLQNLCKPGRNSMQDSPIVQQFQEARFKEFVNGALQQLQGERAISPIIESLGWVAADQERDNSEHRILLVSDLLEYSDVISHYDSNWQSEYEASRTRILNQCPNLDNAQLDLIVPTRPNEPNQNNNLVTWWLEYLVECGGTVNSVSRVTGTI